MSAAIDPVAQALRVQGRVILAVILRETRTRFGRHRLGYLWALAEPLAHVATLLLIFGALDRRSPIGGDLLVFFVTGIVPFLLFNHLAARLMNAVGGNQALLSYPQVTPLDLMLARLMLEATAMLLVFCMLIGGLVIAGRSALPDSPLEVLGAFGGVVLLGSGLGMLNSAIRLYLPAYERIYSVMMRPLYFVSGIFFAVGSLPQSAREWLLWNPLLHLIEWLRSGFFPGFDSQYVDRSYALGWGLGLFFLGLAAERVSRRQAMQG